MVLSAGANVTGELEETEGLPFSRRLQNSDRKSVGGGVRGGGGGNTNIVRQPTTGHHSPTSVNRFKIDSYDYAVPLRAARKFLSDGHEENRNVAIELIKRFQNEIGKVSISQYYRENANVHSWGTEESKDFNQRNICVIQKVEEQKKKKKPKAREISLSSHCWFPVEVA
ncbi:hypothetical protein QJS10_CPA02g01331 [Acorus calamus]|uniref:Uncharacterized protein n=1 Tax=Acorus calamus TaxID=4465 RepID=A0AAV9FCR4_ACOCL|nr:hypothetical protein QJS10_CPA02g01331 [Acorus calamus]